MWAVFLCLKNVTYYKLIYQTMAYTGVQHGNRVDNFGERKLYAKVVDNVLNSASYSSRLMGMGKPMSGKTYDYTIKITDSGAGEFFTGLEDLSVAASDTTIALSYSHAAFSQPVVSIMLESFANDGPEGTIDLDVYKLEEAKAEAVSRLGTSAFGQGTGNQPLGLEAIVDDGTNLSTIGGQSRSTYSALNATVTASSGTVSLAKLATLYSAVSASGVDTEEPTLNVTTKTVWDLYESLLAPQVRADYASVGYNMLPVRGTQIVKAADLKGHAGFTVLTYRGRPVLKDDKCTAGVWYALNERYIEWRGRVNVPTKYKGRIERVDLGSPSTTEGVMANMPSSYGWFFQPYQMLPAQAGMIARIYVIGQMCTSQPRRNGKLTGITSV